MIDYLAHDQQRLSRTGEAANQCPACGVFRIDGHPPTVHRTDCGLGPDGSQIGPLRTGGTAWREWRRERHTEPARPASTPAPRGAAVPRRRTRR